MLRSYFKLPAALLNCIYAEFFIQFINVSFLAIQVIFMQKSGYSDHESAGYIAFRFLGVILFALPLGFYIRGKKIKPLFYLSTLGVPFFALAIIWATVKHYDVWLYVFQFLWGVSFTFIQVPVIPFILRNSTKEQQTEAISLSYSTYSFAGMLSGALIFVLNKWDPVLFNETRILTGIVFISFIGTWFVYRIKLNENTEDVRRASGNYDWKLIFKSMIPTLIIAVGAGLTIPFVSIFFYNVHGMQTDAFGALSASASVLVVIGALLVPSIKKHIGYKIAIPTTQSFAVIALALLATTQFYADLSIALPIAVFCFLLRQPLMNMAGPMTTELVMNYTGKKNHEMVSALTSAIWSGSWFISGLFFKYLRQSGIDYAYVFLITAFLYGIGVVWYYVLIIDYHRMEKQREKSMA